VGLIIPDEILLSAHISEAELKQEIAILLFQKQRLTLAQASRFAGMGRLEFQHLLASRAIPLHYDAADFRQDLQTLHELERS
jgi:predicted HTH domain antitoxin